MELDPEHLGSKARVSLRLRYPLKREIEASQAGAARNRGGPTWRTGTYPEEVRSESSLLCGGRCGLVN